MKHCLICYRLIENDADYCPFCGNEQKYESNGKIARYKKCPNCSAFLYNEVEGCQACGYRKKQHKSLLLKVSVFACFIAVLGIVLFLLLSAGS